MSQAIPSVQSLDHLVLTVTSIATTVDFYQGILGMRAEQFQPTTGPARWALMFGTSKINLHEAGNEFEPKAAHPTAGSADLCFLTDVPLTTWIAHLDTAGIAVEEGPIARTGATGPLTSIYIRDPDRNLIEIATSP